MVDDVAPARRSIGCRSEDSSGGCENQQGWPVHWPAALEKKGACGAAERERDPGWPGTAPAKAATEALCHWV